jgi:hypothetical protein
MDGISNDLLRLVCEPAEDGSTPLALAYITSIVNAGFRIGAWARRLKDGVIVMLPKSSGVDGAPSSDVDNMRPITLLSELGKVSSRILANRIYAVFAKNPMFLEQAQRGFIRNGGIDQCIDVLLDVIEDNAMRRRSARRRPRAEQPDLYVLSYDQRKAFDSVQQYSI